MHLLSIITKYYNNSRDKSLNFITMKRLALLYGCLEYFRPFRVTPASEKTSHADGNIIAVNKIDLPPLFILLSVK